MSYKVMQVPAILLKKGQKFVKIICSTRVKNMHCGAKQAVKCLLLLLLGYDPVLH